MKQSDFMINQPLSEIMPGIQGSVDMENLHQKLSYGKVRVTGYYDAFAYVKNDPSKGNVMEFDRTGRRHEQKQAIADDSFRVVIEDRYFNRKDFRMNPEKYYTRAAYSADLRVDDVITLFGKEISGKKDDNAGIAKLKLLTFKQRLSPTLLIFSFQCLFTPVLLGCPLTSVRTSIAINVDVLDKYQNVLGTYEGLGKGNAFVAAYWAYGKDAWRKSSVEALKNAMQEVKGKIAADKERIVKLMQE
jgi:hypothetical protein